MDDWIGKVGRIGGRVLSPPDKPHDRTEYQVVVQRQSVGTEKIRTLIDWIGSSELHSQTE